MQVFWRLDVGVSRNVTSTTRHVRRQPRQNTNWPLLFIPVVPFPFVRWHHCWLAVSLLAICLSGDAACCSPLHSTPFYKGTPIWRTHNVKKSKQLIAIYPGHGSFQQAFKIMTTMQVHSPYTVQSAHITIVNCNTATTFHRRTNSNQIVYIMYIRVYLQSPAVTVAIFLYKWRMSNFHYGLRSITEKTISRCFHKWCHLLDVIFCVGWWLSDWRLPLWKESYPPLLSSGDQTEMGILQLEDLLPPPACMILRWHTILWR